MNIATQKIALIQWISNLEDQSLLNQVAKLRYAKTEAKLAKRFFGCGKDIIIKISDDFNEPLEHFNEYLP